MKTMILLTMAVLMVNIQMFASSEKVNRKSKKQKTTDSEMVSTMLSGRIIDQGTGEALTGVKVVLEGTTRTVYTDLDGDFSFAAVKPGNYKIKLNYISYNATTIEEINVVKGANSLMIELEPVNK